MKRMVIGLFFVLSFSYARSMELVPFLKKENKIPLLHYVITSLPKKAQDTTTKYMVRLFEHDKKKIIADLPAIGAETNSMLSMVKRYSDKIKENVDDCILPLRGAVGGGCYGTMSGLGVGSLYGFVDGCLWCWCDVMISSKVAWNIMYWGIPTCGCVGCVTGLCCVITGYSKKIGFIS